MKHKCNWCQIERDFKRVPVHPENPGIHFVCSDCLVPLLLEPKEEFDPDQIPSNEDRIDRRFPIVSDIQILEEHKERIESEILLDLSDRGMKIETLVPFDKERILRLRLQCKDKLFETKGRVAYCRMVEAQEPYYLTGVVFLGEFIEEKTLDSPS